MNRCICKVEPMCALLLCRTRKTGLPSALAAAALLRLLKSRIMRHVAAAMSHSRAAVRNEGCVLSGLWDLGERGRLQCLGFISAGDMMKGYEAKMEGQAASLQLLPAKILVVRVQGAIGDHHAANNRV